LLRGWVCGREPGGGGGEGAVVQGEEGVGAEEVGEEQVGGFDVAGCVVVFYCFWGWGLGRGGGGFGCRGWGG
jgi:hypothetical protein